MTFTKKQTVVQAAIIFLGIILTIQIFPAVNSSWLLTGLNGGFWALVSFVVLDAMKRREDRKLKDRS